MKKSLFAVLALAHCTANTSVTFDAASQTAGQTSACDPTVGAPAQWTTTEVISPCGRPNPLGVADADGSATRGRGYVLQYPVDVTGILLPYQTLQIVVEGDTSNPIRKLISDILPVFDGIHSLDDLWAALGLVKGPDGTRWGMTVMNTPNGQGVTFSCATCHTGSLFGTPVFGLFNRRSRANHMFVESKPIFEDLSPDVFALLSGAPAGDKAIWSMSRDNMRYVQSVDPRAVGLDTALAHTILSLSLRENDGWATKSDTSYLNPRPNALSTAPADVKPATWWLTKYKTRFFSDGGLVSGNPVLGSLLVNELSRGTDLHDLDAWIDANQDIVTDLTTAVFSAEPPSFFDFFDPSSFDLAGAQRGQAVFTAHCQGCHGTYAKGWDASDSATRTQTQLLATTQVRYFDHTSTHNVGTDMNRAQAINYMQDMNSLVLAQKYDFVLTPQNGYVAPPLVGIWARWPYFHNGSAQSLCAVLTAAGSRATSYTYGDVVDQQRDFDSACNGFPTSAPSNFTDTYDTTIVGLANTGHDEGIFLSNGTELLSPGDKSDLIKFLQTL